MELINQIMMKIRPFPKESEQKTYLMPEHEQRALKRIVGEKDFLDTLKSISFQVVCQGKLPDEITNIHPVCPLNDNPIIPLYGGVAVSWQFK